MNDDTTEERYDAFREIADAVGGYGQALRVLTLFGADGDLVDEAINRIVTNGAAGRIGGTVVRNSGGKWTAHAECGPNQGATREFDYEASARRWLRHGDVLAVSA